MRAIILLLSAALCCGSVQALVPHQINYQGYLTNPGGTPVNATLAMAFSLYDGKSAGANQLFTENQNVTVANGVLSVLIGAQPATPLTLAFDVPYWLGVKVGSDAEMAPREPVAAAADALRSASSEAATRLATARTINGVAFDGTANITVAAGSAVLTGLALGSVTVPTISFAGDADTGILSPGANTRATKTSPWGPMRSM